MFDVSFALFFTFRCCVIIILAEECKLKKCRGELISVESQPLLWQLRNDQFVKCEPRSDLLMKLATLINNSQLLID